MPAVAIPRHMEWGSAGITVPKGPRRSNKARATRSIGMAKRRERRRPRVAKNLPNFVILRRYHLRLVSRVGCDGAEGSLDALCEAVGLGRVDKRDSYLPQVLIQDCFLGSSHGSRRLVGCGVGADRAAAAT